LNGITPVPNFMKIHQVVQKLLVRDTHTHTHTETDGQTGDLMSLLSFLESRLNIVGKVGHNVSEFSVIKV
jgi:hypothetical protein